ncbi:MAG: ADYC domain-containing protein [Polyangia bacterium]
MRLHYSLFAATAGLLAACSEAPPPAPCGPDAAAQTGCLTQVRQEGRSFQGRSFQGRSFQGTSTSILTVQQIRIGGVPVDDLRLEGSLLSGAVGGRAVAGADFIGAVVTQQEPDGSLFDSTVTDVRTDPRDPAAEIVLYSLSAYNLSTGTQDNVCSPDPEGERWATPVYGTWDGSGAHLDSPTQFLFACTSGVIAKCVRWGYKPWKVLGDRSLAEYHQACTRMARADYCGDGVSYTQDGTLIDLYDDLRIQQRAPLELSSLLLFDAAWTPQGAYCIAKDRWLSLQALGPMLSCKTRFISVGLLPLASPVDPEDLCLLKRDDVPRSAAHLDNRSALNIRLL